MSLFSTMMFVALGIFGLIHQQHQLSWKYSSRVVLTPPLLGDEYKSFSYLWKVKLLQCLSYSAHFVNILCFHLHIIPIKYISVL